jgi:chitinase
MIKLDLKRMTWMFLCLSIISLWACNKEEITAVQSEEQIAPVTNYAVTSDEPVVLGYFPSWSESWASGNSGSKLRDMPEHVTHVFLAFARPNMRYEKGSYSLSGTGVQTPYNGATLKESVDALHSKGIKVILSVGGETYWGSSAAYDIEYAQIKDFVDDMGFDGIDWDFEPSGSFANIGSPENVNRFIEFFNNSRAIMPKGEYILACAPAGVGALGGQNNNDPQSPFAYSKRNEVTGESDANLYNATQPNEAISLFGFGATGHMIPVMQAVGDKIDLIAFQGYNTGAASRRSIMYDAYRYYADQYGFKVVAGTHFPDEPWGPYFEYTYDNVASLSSHIAAQNPNDGIMIWQLLLEEGGQSAYGYLHVASQVLNGTSEQQAIANAENYPESPYGGGGDDDGGDDDGTGCDGAPQWSSGLTYTAGSEVVYQGELWRAQWWADAGIAPPDNSGPGKPWLFVTNCDGDDDGGTNEQPTTSLTSPATGSEFEVGSTITITATASDTDGTVASVSFYVGNTLIGEDTSSPYAIDWTPAASGSYSLSSQVTDNEGASSSSATVSVTISNGDTGTGDCAGVPQWEAYPTVYNTGDRVVYNGVLYEAQTGPLWVEPGSGEHWWQTIGTCD